MPLHGYFFRMLKAPGPSAPGGAMTTEIASAMKDYNPTPAWRKVQQRFTHRLDAGKPSSPRSELHNFPLAREFT